VVELTVRLAREMLEAAGVRAGPDPVEVLRDGRAMDVWRRMITAQGGDPRAPLPVAAHRDVVAAPASGMVTALDALAVGTASWRLGAGRARKEDAVSFGAGIELHAAPGDTVAAGQPLMTLHADDPARFAGAREALAGAVVLDTEHRALPLVLEKVSA